MVQISTSIGVRLSVFEQLFEAWLITVLKRAFEIVPSPFECADGISVGWISSIHGQSPPAHPGM